MRDKIHKYLVDWIVDYLKNKDILLKRIELIEKDKGGFDVYVKSKDKEQFFIVRPLMDDIEGVLSKFDSGRYFGLILLNTKRNFDVLVKEWSKFVKIKKLCIYFVNPFSKLDKKWVIYPYTHNNICEKGTLEKGLKAMFEMVEPLTEGQIKKIQNNE